MLRASPSDRLLGCRRRVEDVNSYSESSNQLLLKTDIPADTTAVDNCVRSHIAGYDRPLRCAADRFFVRQRPAIDAVELLSEPVSESLGNNLRDDPHD